MKDSDGNIIHAGDKIVFSYGIPPLRDGKLIALTAGHTPKEIELEELKKFSQFYKNTDSKGEASK